MKYLSVCSGIEAASVAWHPLGWEPVAFSEIEPFPSAVLAHHYPSVPNFGDMTKFQEWPDEPVELLVGGTPCQSFSVAGLRKGLEDPRGNLMLTYLAIAQRYRPRWVVWENVPGVLSSNGGRDFGTFLGALGELGYGWAYRVLDAQWFGVAQRRRRVFVVAHLGDAQRAAKVLFERESVQRNPAPSREAREGAAASVGGGTYLGNAEGGALDAPYLTCSNIQSHVNNQTPLVAQPIAFHAKAQACQLPGLDRDTSISDSLTRSQQAAVAQPVATDIKQVQWASGGGKLENDTAQALRSNAEHNYQFARIAMQVRRLTPVECERLQGFPDGYTNIPWRKSPEAPDGPRYKALGNSMAVPCMAWIGQRIAEVDRGD